MHCSTIKKWTFLIFTCNTKKNFGTSAIKNWLDNEQWKKSIGGYEDLDIYEQKEVLDSMIKAGGVLLLRIWEEVTKLFLCFIMKSPHRVDCDSRRSL